jgi:WhiB family redox-sensing transcriptional regulator
MMPPAASSADAAIKRNPDDHGHELAWRCRLPGRRPGPVLPDRDDRTALDQINEAKRICLACPVRKRCLAWALELGAASGIWGGTTEDERRALRRAAVRHRNRARKTAIHE